MLATEGAPGWAQWSALDLLHKAASWDLSIAGIIPSVIAGQGSLPLLCLVTAHLEDIHVLLLLYTLDVYWEMKVK